MFYHGPEINDDDDDDDNNNLTAGITVNQGTLRTCH